ncbi:hypothetical protein D3C77_475420 [compost metagenome]
MGAEYAISSYAKEVYRGEDFKETVNSELSHLLVNEIIENKRVMTKEIAQDGRSEEIIYRAEVYVFRKEELDALLKLVADRERE